MRTTKCLILIALLLPTASLSAQICNGAVEPQKAEITYSGEIDCNAGISGQLGIGGAVIAVRERKACPHAMTIVPAHNAPSQKDNSGFLVIHHCQLPVQVVLFKCEDYGWLFFTNHACEVDRTINAGVVEHYRLRSCDLERLPGTEQ